MGRESLLSGGPRPGGALTFCQGDPVPLLPTGESSGCSQMGVGAWVLTDGCCGLWGHGGSRPPGLALPGTGTAGRQWWLSPCVPYSHRHRVRWWGLCRAGA